MRPVISAPSVRIWEAAGRLNALRSVPHDATEHSSTPASLSAWRASPWSVFLPIDVRDTSLRPRKISGTRCVVIQIRVGQPRRVFRSPLPSYGFGLLSQPDQLPLNDAKGLNEVAFEKMMLNERCMVPVNVGQQLGPASIAQATTRRQRLCLPKASRRHQASLHRLPAQYVHLRQSKTSVAMTRSVQARNRPLFNALATRQPTINLASLHRHHVAPSHSPQRSCIMKTITRDASRPATHVMPLVARLGIAARGPASRRGWKTASNPFGLESRPQSLVRPGRRWGAEALGSLEFSSLPSTARSSARSASISRSP
ncbi:hypothetical protein PsYK624_153640 [Phanerochaete sordida]|uniref:Uncharacterized protein n=1 Tax=Phanerochaete sordida TaxID=48140 RepID=A0A9P3LKY5_9APHY|nr:hypothetical protein PsYK624_153640 [Phanerochaete sordida]